MAGRGRAKEVALQVEVESQEEWEELISKEGLTVIDVYQEWCGPCKAMVSNFKRFKNEIGDDLLKFAVAKSDAIEALERYRGKCEPCFLFYAGGLLVDVIRGANSPFLQKKIISQLAHEHEVLKGFAERKGIHDPNFPHKEDRQRTKTEAVEGAEDSDDESSDEDEDETRVYVEKMFTIGIIKPDVYAEGKADEITEKIRESGFDILEQMERIFAPTEVKELYSTMVDEPSFNEVIKDMCNGTCVIFVLSKGEYGEGIINEWKEFLGPEVITEAKEKAPKSLRAIYCKPSQLSSNGFHASNSLEAAKRELNLFFPDFVVPKISIAHVRPQLKPMTIAIIRPGALANFKEEILEKIASDKFKIEFRKEFLMTQHQAEEFYKAQREAPYYEELVKHMASGPMLVLALSSPHEDAVEDWRNLLGSSDVEKAAAMEPDSYRGKFTLREMNINLLHGSDTRETAQKEFDYFFPMEQTLVAIKPHAYYDKDAIIHRILQANFRIVARKEIDLTPEKVKMLYHNCASKEFFSNLTGSMTQGPTTFLVLSMPNAMANWRALAGPTDPEIARTEFPQSIRALFGMDILRNAVHTPSNLSAAKEEMALIFGDLQFDADGSLKKKKKQKKRSSSADEDDSLPIRQIETPKDMDDYEDQPAAMPVPDKFEKGTALPQALMKDVTQKIYDAVEDSQVDELDVMDADVPNLLDVGDDQREDVEVKDVLLHRLIMEEIPPERWGVEVEVPLGVARATPFSGEILLEKSPEESWAEQVLEIEQLAKQEREAAEVKRDSIVQVMKEEQEFIDMMAEQNKVPELLAEEKWEEGEKELLEHIEGQAESEQVEIKQLDHIEGQVHVEGEQGEFEHLDHVDEHVEVEQRESEHVDHIEEHVEGEQKESENLDHIEGRVEGEQGVSEHLDHVEGHVEGEQKEPEHLDHVEGHVEGEQKESEHLGHVEGHVEGEQKEPEHLDHVEGHVEGEQKESEHLDHVEGHVEGEQKESEHLDHVEEHLGEQKESEHLDHIEGRVEGGQGVPEHLDHIEGHVEGEQKEPEHLDHVEGHVEGEQKEPEHLDHVEGLVDGEQKESEHLDHVEEHVEVKRAESEHPYHVDGQVEDKQGGFEKLAHTEGQSEGERREYKPEELPVEAFDSVVPETIEAIKVINIPPEQEAVEEEYIKATQVMSEELETPYAEPDSPKEDIKGFPKEEEASYLPFPDDLLAVSFQSLEIEGFTGSNDRRGHEEGVNRDHKLSEHEKHDAENDHNENEERITPRSNTGDHAGDGERNENEENEETHLKKEEHKDDE